MGDLEKFGIRFTSWFTNCFSKVVQARAEVKGQELTNEELCELFKQEYFIDYDDEAQNNTLN